MLETKRIELGDGDYAVAIKELLHRTSRQVQQYYRRFMKPMGKAVLLSDVQAGRAALLNDYEIDMASVDEDEVAEIFVLNQVTEWSFGAVTSETITSNNMPSSKYEALKKELNELYKPAPFLGKPGGS
jgi:hypothetical protein